MTIAYSTLIRNAQMQAVADEINGGGGAGLLRMYDGSRPSSGGTVTNLLAELTFSATMEASVSGGVLTADTITAEDSAPYAGTNNATWFRVVDAAGTFCIDGDIAASGADLNMTSVAITQGEGVEVNSFAITAGNP